jgi:mRNA interferase MazF
VPTLSILALQRATEPWARMRAASATLWIGRKILWATSTMKRGEVWWVNFDPSIGSEIRKTRPAVIVSNDTSNQFSKRVQVVPATSNTDKLYPPECYIQIKGQTSKIMADQIMTVSKERLYSRIGKVTDEELAEIERVISLQLALIKR